MGQQHEHPATPAVHPSHGATAAIEAHLTAGEVVDRLGLTPLPGEGGHWRPGPRTAELSSILFLLGDGDAGFSALHRLTVTEGWQWLAGAAADVTIQDGPRLRTSRIGPPGRGSLPGNQLIVPPGAWQGARTDGRCTLVGCWCAPAFCEDGFELADRSDLLRRFPHDRRTVLDLTRASPDP